MFNSRIHFRTNTFDILSHLGDRETDGRYMRETLYRHCKFSANFMFRKMFYPQNFVV
jgi:hypothetical protein